MSKANNLRNLNNLRTFLFLGSKTRFSEMAAAEGAQGAQVAHAFPRARAREGAAVNVDAEQLAQDVRTILQNDPALPWDAAVARVVARRIDA